MCHDFRRSRSLSLFGRRSAIADPLFIFHLFCLCFTHLVLIPQLHVHYLTLCFPRGFCACLFVTFTARIVGSVLSHLYLNVLSKFTCITHLCCPAPDSSATATPRSITETRTTTNGVSRSRRPPFGGRGARPAACDHVATFRHCHGSRAANDGPMGERRSSASASTSTTTRGTTVHPSFTRSQWNSAHAPDGI